MFFIPSRNFIALAIFLIGIILFTVSISHQEIVGFESRFYLFALEMWRHGFTWFPTTYGQPYPDYPVMPTLFIYGLAKLVGHLNKFIAVLPSAVAAAASLSVTYLIGSLHNQRWGIFAVFFLLLTNIFVVEARTISPDQFIVLITSLCFYIIYRDSRLGGESSFILISLLFLVGFACRGPIGLIIPAGVVFIYYAIEKNISRLIKCSIAATITLFIGCIVLFSMAYHVGGQAFVKEVWRMEVSGRLQDASLPWYFYFIESLGAYALTYPLAVLVFGGVFKNFKTFREQEFLLKLLGWILIILIGLSIPAGKKIRYILAIAPALSLTCAALFGLSRRQPFLIFLRHFILTLCFLLPAVFFVSLSYLYVKRHQPELAEFILAIPIPIVLLTLFGFQMIMIIMRRRSEFIVGIAALTFLFINILVIEPINLTLKKGRDFVSSIELLRKQRGASLIFYKENPDGVPIKYLVNMATEEKPIFINDPETFLKFDKAAVFISDVEHFQEIEKTHAVKKIMQGMLGRNDLIVFEKR